MFDVFEVAQVEIFANYQEQYLETIIIIVFNNYDGIFVLFFSFKLLYYKGIFNLHLVEHANLIYVINIFLLVTAQNNVT